MKSISIRNKRSVQYGIVLYTLLILCLFLLISAVARAAPSQDPLQPDCPLAPLCETPPPQVDPSITCKKLTNGVTTQADGSDAPLIPVGAPITWEYWIHNNGDLKLFEIAVIDDQGVIVTCPATALAEGDSMTCLGTGIATDLNHQLYRNQADVTGKPHNRNPVTATCVSYYRNPTCSPAIDIEKWTNGIDADSGPGPEIQFGSTVTWTYIVTNIGQEPLGNVKVTDDHLGLIATIGNLPVGATHTETKTGIADQEQYANLARVSGTSSCGDVSDQDPSHYHTTCIPGIDIEKWTNGVDADVAPGPYIQIGAPITWTYIVENNGSEMLSGVTVTDDQLGTICTIGDLAAGATERCTAVGVALEGQYANNAAVTGLARCGQVNDQDPSHYFGYRLGVDLEKACAGVDADQPPGPVVSAGSPTTWRYAVRNTGTLALSNLMVTDDHFSEICTIPSLAVGQTETCTYSSTIATAQVYANLGTVIGYAEEVGSRLSRVEARVEDSDPSHCNFVAPTIGINKTLSQSWIYTATNSGDRPLANLDWTTPPGIELVPSPAPYYVLQPGESWSTHGICSNYQTCGGEISCSATTLNGSHTVWASLPAILFPQNLQLTVTLNGETPTEPTELPVALGAPIVWRYSVTNKTMTALTDVELYHTRLADVGFDLPIPCPQTTLAVDETMICSVNDVAQAGPVTMAGYVQAQGLGADVVASAISHYFGMEPATIKGRAFLDLYEIDPAQANGIQDPDELGSAVVDVELYAVGNPVPVATTHTDSSGRYTFGVMPGDYYVRFVQLGTDPADWLPWSKPNQLLVGGSSNDALDSDGIPESAQAAKSDPFTVASGAVSSSWDVGLLNSRFENALYLPMVCH